MSDERMMTVQERLNISCTVNLADARWLVQQLAAAQATIAQLEAQVAEWQREYVDQGKRFSAATERQIDTFKRLVREKIELREQLAARDAQVAELTAAGERLYIELYDAIGYEGVYPRVQDALEAWRALLTRTPAAPEADA